MNHCIRPCLDGLVAYLQLSFLAPEGGACASGVACVPGARAVQQDVLPEPASATAARPHRQE